MNEFGRLFENYKHEAFRLELLPEYNVVQERQNFATFLQTGEAIQDDDLMDYLKGAKEKIQAGARHIRARVLDRPINKYQDFETQVGYIPLSKLGGELHFIDRPDYNVLLKNLSIETEIHDFWLFDNIHLALMKYNDDGSWNGFEIVSDQRIIDLHLSLKDGFINNSYGIDEVVNVKE